MFNLAMFISFQMSKMAEQDEFQGSGKGEHMIYLFICELPISDWS